MPDVISFEQAMQIMTHARQAMTTGAPAGNAEASPEPAPAALPKHGPHNPVLSEDQAHLLQLLWLVTGQNANTVGRGSVLHFKPVDAPSPPEPAAPTGNAGAMPALAE